MITVVIGTIAVLGLFFIGVTIRDCNRFVIKEYEVISEKLKRDETFVLLSDLHSKSFGKQNEKLKAAIREIAPDKILIAGDMYTSAAEEDGKVAEELVTDLAGKYPVYYANGNHEQKMKLRADEWGSLYENYAQKIQKAGVRYLVNEKVNLPQERMIICGTEIDRCYYAKLEKVPMEEKYMEKLLGKADTTQFQVLIAHNPDYFEAYAAWGADLVVAGHVHGGLMRLPILGGVISPTLRLFPKYDGGRFEKDGCVMILGRGLGSHTLPIRIFNPGELVVIRCRCRQKM